MPKGTRFYSMLALIVAAIISLVGCSSDSPLQSSPSQLPTTNDQTSRRGGQSSIELFGRVETIDPEGRTMTLIGQAGLISVQENAEVVFKGNGVETPITLAEIMPDDSVEVRGDWQSGDLFSADRVRVRPDDDNNQNETEFQGIVESIDAGSRTMTVSSFPNLITVAMNAEIVQKDRGIETPIGLADIIPGDFVEIKGNSQPDGSVLATRVRLRLNMDDIRTDLEFKSVISSIDYLAGTFTVESRPETITTDANTTVFLRSGRHDDIGTSASGGDDDDGDDDGRWKEPAAFTDLSVGDLVEVHADFVDANTLYAAVIELEDDGADAEVEFKDFINTIDPNTGSVTFQNNSWSGTVLESAILLGLNGETLMLSDFSSGELVEVHGFQTGEGTFDIVMMEKDNSL